MIDNVMTAAQASVMAFFYGDINIYGSALTAAPTGRIEVTAGRALNLYAIENLDESSSDVKKKSSFLGIRYNKNHTNDTRQELTQLPTTLIGGKAYTKSGGSTLLQGTVFDTLNPDDIQVGVGKYADAKAQIILDTITTRITTTHNQEKESTVWQKTVDKGDIITTGTLPKFNQTPTMTSPNGVVIVVPVDVTVSGNNQAKLDIQKSPEELGKIALNLSKQPGYEYLAALDKTNNINWAQVDLIQKNWNYTQEGLTPGAAALIAIAVGMATGGTGALGASSFGITSAAGSAAFSSLASQAAVTLINNKGDISKTLKQLASSETIRSIATSALTAGVGAKFGLGSSVTDTFGQKLANGVGTGLTQAVADAVINGVSFEEALKNSLRNSLVDVFAASVFTGIVKPIDADDFASNLAHKLVAAGVGCVTASAKQQSCDAGAIGAAVGEMLGDYLVDDPNALNDLQRQKIIDAARLVAGSVALLTNVDVNTAADTASIAVKNNSTELVYQAEADALWIDVNGDKEKYNQGLKRIAERDAIAFDILTAWTGIGTLSKITLKTSLLYLFNPIHPTPPKSTAAELVLTNNRTGTALLKEDSSHRAASFLSIKQLKAGKTFYITGGDKVKRVLPQTPGYLNVNNVNQKGIYEYIIEPSGSISHQRFIKDGVITGVPNSRVIKK